MNLAEPDRGVNAKHDIIPVLVGFTMLLGACTSGDQPAMPPETTAPTSSTVFDINRGVRLGVNVESTPPTVEIPDCFGAIIRVAVVAPDLRSTLWEATAKPGAAEPISEFSIGEPPPSFMESVPLREDIPPNAFVVVNGPDTAALVIFADAERHASCDRPPKTK